MQLPAKDHQQGHTQYKARNCIAHQHQQAGDRVEAGTGAHCLGNAQRHRDQVTQEKGPQTQADRNRHFFLHERPHILGVEKTLAQVKARELPQHLHKALGCRLVKAIELADFGDARCGLDLTHPGRRAVTTIAAVEGDLALVLAGLGGAADGVFTDGRLTFTTGANAGFSTEVKSQSGALVRLWQRPPAPVVAGDGVTVTMGCDKRFTTCRDRFGNAVNFRGFPHMPGNDYVISIAIAGEGGHDGTVLT
ncbi:MAG: hypothetical protein B7X76_11380 [Azorhizobium sp. 39-67-5]|nr:MAG: hypothetical protein B7X76_11380 [Azorhizobium sp. 39-67-5]